MSSPAASQPRRRAPAPPGPGPAWFRRNLPFDPRLAVTDGELLVLIVCNLISTVGLAGDISRHLLKPAQLLNNKDFLSGFHLVLYGGVAMVGLWLGLGAVRRGPAFVRAAPATALGFGLLTLGGFADASWHAAFGVEVAVEALVSPPHLVVFAGLVFLLSSPVAILWKRPVSKLGVIPSIAAAASVVAVILVIQLFTGFLSPLAGGLSLQGYVEPLVGESLQDYDQVRGLGIAVWTVTVLVAATSIVLVRFRPVPGTMFVSYALIGVPALVVTEQQRSATDPALLTTYNAAGQALTAGDVRPLVYGFIAAGLACEVVVALFGRPVLRRVGLAVNGAVVGGTLWGVTFLFLKLDDRLKWNKPLGGGIVTLSALIGATVASLVALPVPGPDRPAGSEPDSPGASTSAEAQPGQS